VLLVRIVYSVLCSEMSLISETGIRYMYTYTFFLRMTDTMTYQNIDLSFRDTLYTKVFGGGVT
jgi:hypothetical protein